jgi:hypothetical protein
LRGFPDVGAQPLIWAERDFTARAFFIVFSVLVFELKLMCIFEIFSSVNPQFKKSFSSLFHIEPIEICWLPTHLQRLCLSGPREGMGFYSININLSFCIALALPKMRPRFFSFRFFTAFCDAPVGGFYRHFFMQVLKSRAGAFHGTNFL